MKKKLLPTFMRGTFVLSTPRLPACLQMMMIVCIIQMIINLTARPAEANKMTGSAAAAIQFY